MMDQWSRNGGLKPPPHRPNPKNRRSEANVALQGKGLRHEERPPRKAAATRANPRVRHPSSTTVKLIPRYNTVTSGTQQTHENPRENDPREQPHPGRGGESTRAPVKRVRRGWIDVGGSIGDAGDTIRTLTGNRELARCWGTYFFRGDLLCRGLRCFIL
jgi:hypothetical protein